MSNFDFLLTDIGQQKRIAQGALNKAEEIEQLLKDGNITDENAKKALEESKDWFLIVARELARNINTTASTANTVLKNIKRSSF